MAVSFIKKIKIGLPSNKQEEEGEEIEYRYEYKVDNNKSIYFLNPVIDKITIVFPIPNPDFQKAILSLLMGLAKDPKNPEYQNSHNKVSPYTQSFKLTEPHSKHDIKIYLKPSKPKVKYLRFEFNPGKLGKKGMKYFKSKLIDFLLEEVSYKDIVEQGNVTRIDYACDILNCSISDLLIRSKKEGKSHAYFGVDEEIETIYLAIGKGQKSSGHYVYNKRQDLQDKNRSEKYGGTAWTRVESRIKAGRPIYKLPDIVKNPLDPFYIYPLSVPEPPEEQHHWILFMDSCWHRGIDGALNLLPDTLRPKYEQALLMSQDKFWRPDYLWGYWKAALNDCGLMDFD